MTSLIASFIIATSFITAFLSSIFGMLGGLILMALLVNLLPSIGEAFVLHGFIQLASNAYRAFLNRANIQWRIIMMFLIGSILSLAFFFFMQWSPNKITVMLLLGLLPFFAIAIPKNKRLNATKPPQAFLSGFVVGLVSLLTGVGGPLLDIFFQRTELSRHQVVATKAVAQSLGHSIKIIYFGGLLAGAAENFPPAWLLALCLVTTVIGTTLGKRVLDNMQDVTFFRWTNCFLLTIGAILIVRAVLLFTAS